MAATSNGLGPVMRHARMSAFALAFFFMWWRLWPLHLEAVPSATTHPMALAVTEIHGRSTS